MPVTTSALVGFEEWKKQIMALPDAIGRNVLRGATGAASSEVRKQCIENAYSAFETRTGSLLRAIYQKQIPERSSIKEQTFFVSVRQGTQEKSASKKADKSSLNAAFYWRFLEFGTRKMSARPFMRPALIESSDRAIEAARKYLAERIPEEAKKLGL